MHLSRTSTIDMNSPLHFKEQFVVVFYGSERLWGLGLVPISELN